MATKTAVTRRKAVAGARKTARKVGLRMAAATVARTLGDKVTGRDRKKERARVARTAAAGVALAAVTAGVAAMVRRRNSKKRK
jgi:hypothetical protein